MAAISAAVLAASSAAYLGKEAQRKSTDIQDRNPPVLSAPEPCKCPGCGSFEYEMLGSRNVCSYCRTPKIG
jgi:hypothetical protein